MIKALIGNGGHAREIMAQMENTQIVRFVEDNYCDYENDLVMPISKFDPKVYEVLVAIGDSKLRSNIVKRLPKDTKYFTFVHPTALILDSNVNIGEGSFIGAFSILTTNIKIGKHSLLNRSNHIGHDTICGDYFSMMPGSILSGGVKTGESVYIGTNASVKERIIICDDVIVGLNAAVVKNISESGTYVGAPAKKIQV